MSKYITRDKDYTGCHPVIAEHLSNNKNIKCIVWDDEGKGSLKRWVHAFDPGSGFPYVTNGADYKNAEPIVSKKVVKQFWPLIRQLEADGFSPDYGYHGNLVEIRKKGKDSFLQEMFSYCGKAPDPEFTWLDQWLEEVEE
jgi:hypothetical protein